VRPYARATFAGALGRARASAGLPIAVNAKRNLKRGVSGHEIRKRAGAPDRSRAQADPVLAIGPDAALRVRGGALDVEHGSGNDRVHVRIDVDEPKPAAILFDVHGEFLTGEAIRWCARYAIPLILPNGPGRAILFYESALEADGAGEGVNGKHAARILDVGPSLVRAQALAEALADPVSVARAIVSAKLKASAESVPAIDKRPWSLSVDEARSVAEIVTIEASRQPTGEPFAIWASASARAAISRAHGSGSPTGKRALNFSTQSTPRIRSTPCSTTPMWSKRGGWREL
jgi:hypothetical protein